jgi:hypothetical protein
VFYITSERLCILILFVAVTVGYQRSENGVTNWKTALSDPKDLSFIDENLYVLEQFHRTVHALDLGSGKELGSLQISLPQILGPRAHEMLSAKTNLAFSRGCEVFVYGD